MAALARWCFRHRWVVLAGWVSALIVLTVVSQAVGIAYSTKYALPNSPSSQALAILGQDFPSASGDADQIVVEAKTGTITSGIARSEFEAMLARVGRLRRVAGVTSPYGPAGAAQISRDGTVAFATVTFDAQAQDLPDAAVTAVIRTAQSADGPNLKVELERAGDRERPAPGVVQQHWARRAPRPDRARHRFRRSLRRGHPDRHRPDRDRHRVRAQRPAQPCARDRQLRPDPRRADRTWRGNRLRPLHRHPAPQRHTGWAKRRGRRRERDQHGRTGGVVRRPHRGNRVARAVRAWAVVSLRRRGHGDGHRRIDDACVTDPAAGSARVHRHEGAQPSRTPEDEHVRPGR